MALGDSYSSGEGAPAARTRFWWEGRDTDRRVAPVNLCHRSNEAYPPIVARALGFRTVPKSPTVPPPPPFEFVACSGAVINQLTSAHPTNVGEPPQLAALRDPDRHTDLVTFTMGGNDMGFATILEYCLLVPSCETDASFAPGMERMVSGSRPILRSAYQAVKAAASPDTHIAVLTYPLILPATSCRATGWWALTDAELDWLDLIWRMFNVRARGAAADVGIHVVDVEASFAGHRICDSVPYAHGIYTEWRWDPTHDAMFSFHPNRLGHQFLAREVLRSLGVARTAPPGSAAEESSASAGRAVAVDPATELTTGEFGFQRGVVGGVATDPARRAVVDLKGFAPGATVEVVYGIVDAAVAPSSSAPPAVTSLGAFVADSGGTVVAPIALPGGEGQLILLAKGQNALGGRHLLSTRLWLLGPCRALGGFVDVPSSHRFCEPIDWLADADVADGYPTGEFGTTRGVTRQAMAAFLHRLLAAHDYTPPSTPSFADVPRGHPFFTEIEWLASEGIAAGYADGMFRPASALSRQAMAGFLRRAFDDGPFVPPGAPSFTDVPTTHAFFAEIEWLTAKGIADGYLGDRFGPAHASSRQAMASFLYRLASSGLRPAVG